MKDDSHKEDHPFLCRKSAPLPFDFSHHWATLKKTERFLFPERRRRMKGLLTAAGLFPHPPIMVPEIGGKETKKIQQTMDAVRKSMKLIMETDPETVVVMSPHNLCLPSGPAIFIKENLAGDLMYFGHPEVSMEFSVDQELAEAVMKEAEPVIPLFRMDEAAAKKFGRKIEIDWGMFVPMYFLKKAAFKGNVLLFSPCFTNYDMNKVLGEIVTNCAEKLGRRIAIVASGDLSHRLTKDSPNGYSPDGIVFDRGVMKALEGKTMEPLLTMTDDFIERIGMCGLPSVYFLFGALSGKEWSIPVLSHEGPFGVGYGVCLCLPEEADGRKEAHDIRVRLARDSIAEYLKTGKLPKPPADIPEELKERAGVFVSLHEFGALRGCIGTILPVRNSAAEEIIHNAKAAASEDPRFPPVNPYELDDLDISVDVLSAPEPISSEGDLDPKIYGVIVERGFRRGLLLPDLPGITDPREQVEIARRKAGIGTDEPVKMYRFTVRRYY